MGQKAFRERLKQIKMSEYDAEIYEKFYSSVRRHVQSLRVVLDSLQAKGLRNILPHPRSLLNALRCNVLVREVITRVRIV